MFIRLDNAHVDGVFNTDGYIDGNEFTPQKLASFIKERVDLLAWSFRISIKLGLKLMGERFKKKVIKIHKYSEAQQTATEYFLYKKRNN